MKPLPLSKSTLLVILAFLLSAFAPTPRAHAELLGSFTYTKQIFNGGIPAVALTPTYWFSADPFPNIPPTSGLNLFENQIVSPDDVGMTWMITAADDPDFHDVANLLTNDVLNPMGIEVTTEFGGSNALFYSEGGLFFGFPGDPDLWPHRDFAGSTIDAFSLTIDEFFITQQGVFFISNITFTFGVHGTIPAPGSAVAFVFLMAWKRRRRS